MVHNRILEDDLLLLLKREVIGELEPLKDSTFVGYKSYNPLAAWKTMVLVTLRVGHKLQRVPQVYHSYLQFLILNRQQPK